MESLAADIASRACPYLPAHVQSSACTVPSAAKEGACAVEVPFASAAAVAAPPEALVAAAETAIAERPRTSAVALEGSAPSADTQTS
uniref:Uncharacterized protein n=1 Tax=Arundo donax TaxID=35708 RepID=A0A0A9EV88_ARUDO